MTRKKLLKQRRKAIAKIKRRIAELKAKPASKDFVVNFHRGVELSRLAMRIVQIATQPIPKKRPKDWRPAFIKELEKDGGKVSVSLHTSEPSVPKYPPGTAHAPSAAYATVNETGSEIIVNHNKADMRPLWDRINYVGHGVPSEAGRQLLDELRKHEQKSNVESIPTDILNKKPEPKFDRWNMDLRNKVDAVLQTFGIDMNHRHAYDQIMAILKNVSNE